MKLGLSMIMNFELGQAVTLTLNIKIDKIEYFENCQTLYRSSSLNVQIWYNKSHVCFVTKRRGETGWGGGRAAFIFLSNIDIVCSFSFLSRQFDYLLIVVIFAMLIIFARHEYNFFKLSPPPPPFCDHKQLNYT